MKLNIKILAFLLIISLPIFAQGKKATLIVHHAVIHTLDDKNTIVEAMAVADGKILKTGKNSEILKLKDKKTTVIDAFPGSLILICILFVAEDSLIQNCAGMAFDL
jgi:hypothetical protein